MINTWQEITQENKIQLIIPILIAVLGVVGYFGKSWVESPKTLTVPVQVSNTASRNGVIQTGQSEQNIVNTGSGTINIGITLEQYEQGLKRREIEVSTKLKQAHAKIRQHLKIELQAIQTKLQNSATSYKVFITHLKERITQLEELQGQFPSKKLELAINALGQGSDQQADQLFKQIEEQADSVIKVAAEAAFQRCLIAEGAIRYLKALVHCEKSIRLAPNNSLYLNWSGLINRSLGNYNQAIEYIELALISDLNSYGEESSKVATDRNNLGITWGSPKKLLSI